MIGTDPIRDLEELVAHQQRMLEELSTEFAHANQLIERHEKVLKELAQRFLALEDAATPRPEITRPPHY